MPRFYLNQPLHTGETLSLTEAVAHHIQVLRLPAGSDIQLFNGQGGEYTAVIEDITKKQVIVSIKSHDTSERELSHQLTLAQALPEGNKLDWILEKSVELGATHIQPLSAQRCVVKLNADRAEKKVQHWEAILIAAAQQCGRNHVPDLLPLASFTQWIKQPACQPRIMLTPRATHSLTQWAMHNPAQDVTIMIGPEGGFSPDEEEIAIASGITMCSIGPRILRTETAGLAAITTLTAIWGEMS